MEKVTVLRMDEKDLKRFMKGQQIELGPGFELEYKATKIETNGQVVAEWPCPKCDTVWPTEARQNIHHGLAHRKQYKRRQLTHQPQEQAAFKCRFCPRSFTTIQGHSAHVGTIHKDEPLVIAARKASGRGRKK